MNRRRFLTAARHVFWIAVYIIGTALVLHALWFDEPNAWMKAAATMILTGAALQEIARELLALRRP